MDDTTKQNQLRINENVSIPLAELQFQFAQSGGPGGQHVNKATTKVFLQFDLLNTECLTEQVRGKLLVRLENRLDKSGVLQIASTKTRSQRKNREDAIERFQQVLAEALKEQKKRRATRPSRRAKQRRLDAKKKAGSQKQNRSWKWDGD